MVNANPQDTPRSGTSQAGGPSDAGGSAQRQPQETDTGIELKCKGEKTSVTDLLTRVKVRQRKETPVCERHTE